MNAGAAEASALLSLRCSLSLSMNSIFPEFVLKITCFGITNCKNSYLKIDYQTIAIVFIVGRGAIETDDAETGKGPYFFNLNTKTGQRVKISAEKRIYIADMQKFISYFAIQILHHGIMKHRSLLRIATFAVALIALAGCRDSGEEMEEARISTRVNLGDTVSETPLLPAKEMRAVWMATVYGIDWPNTLYTQAAQKRLYTKYLDSLKALNINTVFFQVRSMADAFYNSPYEPWSRFITGQVNKNPGYDVLKFLIDEAHKRCMSFHAWINPYRIATRSDNTKSFPALDSRIPKTLIKDYNKIRVFNPALPETRAYLDTIVKDLITKYNVDGIHMDDYFYPSLTSGESMNDDAEYKKYGGSFSDITNWRRENVNLMVQSLCRRGQMDVARMARRDDPADLLPHWHSEHQLQCAPRLVELARLPLQSAHRLRCLPLRPQLDDGQVPHQRDAGRAVCPGSQEKEGDGRCALLDDKPEEQQV